MAVDKGARTVSRRQMLMGSAAVGGAVWVAPAIDSMISPASAGSLPGGHAASGQFCFDADGVDNRPVSFSFTQSPSQVATSGATGTLTYGPDANHAFYVADITCAVFTGNSVTFSGPVQPGFGFDGNGLIATAAAGGDGVGVYHGSFVAAPPANCLTQTPNASDGSVIHTCAPGGPALIAVH